MKFGTETGSVMNHLLSRATKGQPKPEIGMGATILAWTDRYAATVVMVSTVGRNGFQIVGVQRDHATVISGSAMDGSAQYRYEPDPKAPVEYWRFEEGKGWRAVRQNADGRFVLTDGNGLRIGARDEYRDPSF